MIRVTIFIVVILFSDRLLYAQNQPGFDLTSEMKKSVVFNLEAISILDSVAEIVWPGWTTYKSVPIFIGSPKNNAVFINPKSNIPDDFIPYSLIETQHKIFARESSGLRNNYNGTIIKLNDNYYRLIRMVIYDSTISHYYKERVESLLDVEIQQNRINNLLQSPDYYISIITHEAFHFHQEIKESSVYHRTVEPRYYKKSKVLACSFIEGMLLKRAFYSENETETKELVCQFLAIREVKSKYLSKRQRVYEAFEEYQEGSAQYIQTQIQIVLDSLDYKLVYNNYTSLQNASDFLFLDSLCMEASIRDIKDPGNKHYFYGQTQARILDKLSGNVWKSEILNGNTFLIDLLLKYSGYEASDQNKYLEQVNAAYDYSKILQEIRKLRISKNHYIFNE